MDRIACKFTTRRIGLNCLPSSSNPQAILKPDCLLTTVLYWMFFGAFSKQRNLRNNLNLAITLGHELAHLATKSWRPDVSRIAEPLIQPDDVFPEAGLSWEQAVFGGNMFFSREGNPSLIFCRAFEHVWLPQPSIELPLSAPVPVSYMMQWFVKDT
jgi:hypothetical protein